MKKILPILFLIGLFVVPVMVFAQPPEGITIEGVIQNVLYYLYVILFSLALVFLVYGGFLFVTAAGSEEQVGKARKIILYALIGVAIALVSRAAIDFVETIITR